ncbi:RICIN domain-containing protein [Kitasatospora sp. NPDC056446]|uniref:RICIN domain-containing protein n=1 Tax=Kitasatospora sp. NPDC056446 TaxID=3345819 RepID=UPI0036C8092C
MTTPTAHRLRATAGALAAAGTLALTTAAPAHADLPPNAGIQRQIVNAATGKCLEIADWRTEGGAPARQWTCTGGDNQKWIWSQNGQLINVHSGMCLDIPGASTVWGTYADQWECGPDANQKWRQTYVPGTTDFTLVNYASRLALDVYGGGTADGTPVIQWEDKGTDNQRWHYRTSVG